jgi:hypothetical protein
VRCGHEKVYGIEQAWDGRPVDWSGADGDSSYLAVPFLPIDDAVVLHQVRNPLEYARSVVGVNFLGKERRGKPFAAVVERHAPEVYEPDDPIQRAGVLWRVWNTQAEANADITYRIEDLDVALLMSLAELIELDITQDQAIEALAGLSKTTNQRVRHESVQWDHIAPIVGDLAAHYAYEAPR